jgi:hypothetical protein
MEDSQETKSKFDEDCIKYDKVDRLIAYGLIAIVIGLLIMLGSLLPT